MDAPIFSRRKSPSLPFRLGARPLTSKEAIHHFFKTNHGLSGAGLRSARRFALVQALLRKYAWKFHVRIEQVAVQFDHIHLLVRITRQSLFQQFHAHGLGISSKDHVTNGETKSKASRLSVVTDTYETRPHSGNREPASAKCSAVTGTPGNRTSGQRNKPAHRDMGPCPEAFKLWKHRPFTRVVRGWKAHHVVRDYIQLNEKERTGEIRYSSKRLRGLQAEELARLWI